MLVMVGTNNCPNCIALRNKLANLGLDYAYLDSNALATGLYGTPNLPGDPRVVALVGLLTQNLDVPALLLNGILQDISVWLGTGKKGKTTVYRVA